MLWLQAASAERLVFFGEAPSSAHRQGSAPAFINRSIVTLNPFVTLNPEEGYPLADCPEFVIWNPVSPGSKFCAESTAVTSNGTKSDDSNAGVHIVQPGGSATDWNKSDLDPGPSCIALLTSGGYGVSAKLLSGPSGPSVTLHGWIEAPDGSKPFDCTWTNSDAGTEFRVSITIVVPA